MSTDVAKGGVGGAGGSGAGAPSNPPPVGAGRRKSSHGEDLTDAQKEDRRKRNRANQRHEARQLIRNDANYDENHGRQEAPGLNGFPQTAENVIMAIVDAEYQTYEDSIRTHPGLAQRAAQAGATAIGITLAGTSARARRGSKAVPSTTTDSKDTDHRGIDRKDGGDKPPKGGAAGSVAAA